MAQDMVQNIKGEFGDINNIAQTEAMSQAMGMAHSQAMDMAGQVVFQAGQDILLVWRNIF